MDSPRSDDTFDFSALDALSSSSTPRLLRKENNVAQVSNHNNPVQDDDEAPLAQRQDSDYSIHLSALHMRSDSSTINAERDVLKLDSEDIGGPSDFTLNMADWINGPAIKTLSIEEIPVTRDEEPSTLPKHYMPPSVEDSSTPQSARTSTSPRSRAVKTSTPVESSQCLTSLLPLPKDDLQFQLVELQNRCEVLTRTNKDLTEMLEQHHLRINREAELQEQLRNERQLREAERSAAETARRTLERELQLSRDQCNALQTQLDKQIESGQGEPLLDEIRTAAAHMYTDADMAQQDMLDEIESLRKQNAEARQECDNLRVATDHKLKHQQNETTSRVLELEEHITEQKRQHALEMTAIKEEYDGVAKDVDEWIASKVQEKEDYFAGVNARRKAEITQLKTRNKALERLFAECGQELMLAWGREDCSPAQSGGKQRYRYKYA